MSRSLWRPLGIKGRYPSWMAALSTASGVYLIRDARTHALLYVGESHKGTLRKTLTRHFQAWSRSKDWRVYGGAFVGSAHDPGLTYSRARVEVSVVVTLAKDARAAQDRMIRRLKPRDNITGAAPAQEKRSVKRARRSSFGLPSVSDLPF